MAHISKKYLLALGIDNLRTTLAAYNPWWKAGEFTLKTPDFKRDLFGPALRHTHANHEFALLINGPRRVGKTTLIHQLIKHLITEQKIPANRILFFSLDDPIIQQLPPRDQGLLFEEILNKWASIAGTALRTSPNILYCFLDEIQRLPRWELYLKRYVDLGYPIRFIISGSASHTIFRKSLESLLGRLVDISLPPFTFREFVRFHHQEHANFLNAIAKQPTDISNLATIIDFLDQKEKSITNIEQWNSYADEYAQAGGFPQLWDMEDVTERASFVDQQFVQRVTLEDLRLIKEIRRPEIFHQFLRYAFARTAQEYNLEELAGLIHTTRVTLTSALPLLLQTELLRKVERFTGKSVRLRSTHAKLYAADVILSNAITKQSSSLQGTQKGMIAETLAHNVIRLFHGISDISYYREPRGEREIDFIVRMGSHLIPIEVNYQNQTDEKHRSILRDFVQEYDRQSSFGILVTKNSLVATPQILEIPLPIFLLMA